MRLDRRQAFGIAAVLAIVVAGMVYYLLSQSATPQAPEQPQTTPVVVATTNIPAYTKITPGMIEVKQVPVSSAPSNAIGQAEQVVGRLSQYVIANGQLLVRGDVVEAGAAQGLTFVIPQGKRAVTVALDEISGVGGFVYPGDHVDILATFDREEVATTKIILQNIEVLAMNEQTVRPVASRQEASADQQAQGKEEAPATQQVKSTTLAVTPDEAQRLILAAYKGSIHMVLRSREDLGAEYEMAATTDYELMGLSAPPATEEKPAEQSQPLPPAWAQGYMMPAASAAPAAAATPAPAAPAAPAAPTIEVIRGRDHTTVTPDR